MTQEFLSVFSVLFIMLGILGLAAWAVKRFGLIPGQPRLSKGKKHLKVVESQALDARNRIVVVQWQGREYLLGTGQNGVNLIDGPTSSLTHDNFPDILGETKEDTGEKT